MNGFNLLRTALAVVVVLTAGFLVACDRETDAGARNGVHWLRDWAGNRAFHYGWTFQGSYVKDGDSLVLDLVVPNRTGVGAIRARSRIEQVHIARLACPPRGAELWSMIEPDQQVWLNLLGPAGTRVIGTSCKHPGKERA